MKKKVAFVALLVLGDWRGLEPCLVFGAFRSAPEASAVGLTTESGE